MPHYFIDGYNLLFALPEMPSGAWMDKRQKLLRWLIDSLPPKQCIRLPMRTAARSLNLSNAVAVVAYEAWRQLGFVGAATQA